MTAAKAGRLEPGGPRNPKGDRCLWMQPWAITPPQSWITSAEGFRSVTSDSA